MKTCSCCHKPKNPSDYYKGYAKCKSCVCKAAKEYRLKNLERVQEYDRARGLTEERKKRVRSNAHKYKSMRPTYIKRHKEKYPERYKARTILGNALRAGKIQKEGCAVCGDKKVQAHHDDYSQPLSVTWLCTTHHGEHHRKSK